MTWRGVPPGEHELAVGEAAVAVAVDEGPGSTVVSGLPPATPLDVRLDGRRVGRLATLAPPPGRELCRVATVSDSHLGGAQYGFGWLPRTPPPGDDVHRRCLRAALEEAVAWGAELVVAKGDLTHRATAAEWAAVAEVLGGAGAPVVAVPGNHDIGPRADDGAAALAAAGVAYAVGGVAVHDLPGLRVVAADVTVPGRHGGSVTRVADDIVAAAAGAGGGVLVATHQQPQRWGATTHWPPGIPGPESRRLLDALAERHPATLVTAGHTHRHRRRTHGPVVVTEVRSTKDFPGTWAGYVVHEGGIRQVVRRVADRRCLAWTDATRHAFLGVWGRWSAWTLGARCFTSPWP